MDFKKYWAKVDAAAAKIEDEWPYVVGVDDPMRGLSVGSPTQVAREDAAKMIADNRGRLATAEEISAERARTEAMMERFRERDAEHAMRDAMSPSYYGQRAADPPPVVKPSPAKAPPVADTAPTDAEIEAFDITEIRPRMSKRKKAIAYAAIARASGASARKG